MRQADIPDRFNHQELRIALAMSGGVSLAIWMGGVAMEVYRIVLHDPVRDEPQPRPDPVARDVYGGILRLTRSTPRVDIIAGASAGGINGALLAMAMVHNTDLGILQSLWLQQASLSELFRSPLSADPPSLLKGDEYFLPRLREAFDQLSRGPSRSPDDLPLRLIMTTTLLQGSRRTFADDLGSLLPDVVHRGQFLFRRGAGAEDEFAHPDIVDRLALASRSTASFPGAFEPSYVPIGDPPRGRPDMQDVADFKVSRFVVDGGVLVNKPIRPALRAIFAQPAAGQMVRRVFAYVVPDPGVAAPDEPDPAEAKASLTSVVVRSLVSIPRTESVASDLEELVAHNRRARGQKTLRERLLAPPEEGADLEKLTEELFASYRKIRAAQIVDGALGDEDPLRTREAGLTDEAVRVLRWLVSTGSTPWMPTGSERDEAEGWRWGPAALEAAGVVSLDLVRQAVNLCRPRIDELAPFRPMFALVRGTIHDLLGMVRTLRRLETEYMKKEVDALLEAMATRAGDPAAPDLQTWLELWMAEREPFEGWMGRERPGSASADDVAGRLAGTLESVRPLILEAAEVALRTVERKQERGAWESLRDSAHRVISEDDPRDTIRVLADLSLVQYTMASGMPVLEQLVEFVQVSGDTPNGLDDRDTVGQKVAGIQLGHFGSFYKSSWRANDWMWGRLDGAMRLVQILLNPTRLRERSLEEGVSGKDAVAWALEEIEALVLPDEGGDAASRAALEPRWAAERASAQRELAFLAKPEGPVPGSLPICAGAIARRVQLDILRRELPEVARAVARDREDGAAVGPEARHFEAAVDAKTEMLEPEDALRAFARCRVGEERIGDEVGSDLFTSTVATAAAVGMGAGAGSRGGLGPIRALLRSVRTLFLAVYLLAVSAVRKSRTGYAAAVIALAVGGALVAIGFVGKDLNPDASSGFPSSFIDWAGLGLVAAGVLLMAIRAGLVITAVYVVVAISLALFPYAYVRDNYADAGGIQGWLYEVRYAIPVVVLVAASVITGFVRRSPWWRWLAAALAVGWAVTVAYLSYRDYQDPAPWLLIAAPVTALVLGVAVTWAILRKRASNDAVGSPTRTR